MVADIVFWIPFVIVLPLLAAVGAFLLPRLAFPFALGGGGGTAVLTFFLAHLLRQNGGAARHTVGGWGAPLGIDLVLDGLALLMLLVTAVIGLVITLYAHSYFRPPGGGDAYAHQYRYFWPLWLFLWAALNALFLSGDVFNLYVTLELMGFSAVALTALAGKPAVLKAAMRYLLVSLSGSLFYLLGVVFLYGAFGSLDIRELGTAVAPTPALAAAAALITVGLAMKTALFPLHFWLPPAHANAAAPVSALLSALVVKGSFYILLRLWLEVLYPLGDSVAPQLLSALGMAAIVWGSLQAIRQPRLKLLIAYSTVAQLGYLFLLFPILLRDRSDIAPLAGIVFFVLAHACAKAAAFLSAGSILFATNNDRISSLAGLMRKLPLTTTTFSLAGVSLVALPPSAGFLAKWLMLETALRHNAWVVAFMIVAGGLLAAVYIVRVLGPLFLLNEQVMARTVQPVPLLMAWPAFALALLAIMFSFAGIFLLDILAIGAPWLIGGGA